MINGAHKSGFCEEGEELCCDGQRWLESLSPVSVPEGKFCESCSVYTGTAAAGD